MKLFEVDKRRRDWIAGHEVWLGNGEKWTLPIPRHQYVFALIDGAKGHAADNLRPVRKPTEADDNRQFSAKFWDAQAEFRTFFAGVTESTTAIEFGQSSLRLAADLLRRNYELTDEETLDLLPVVPGDERNVQMWIELAQVILAAPLDQPADAPAPAGEVVEV